jgi:class 3 adenylate cyclase/tetratricopeptide (TPR) repeat protein
MLEVFRPGLYGHRHSMSNMHCQQCGAENSANARFCANCGVELAERCPACGAGLPSKARFCPACGGEVRPGAAPKQTAPEQEAAFAGERRQLTVLFADFAGYTAFSHKRDPEDVRDLMDSVWSKLDQIIAAHGGVVEKHIGDAVMALFGRRKAREDDPAQAIRAALAMQASLQEMAETAAETMLQMRVGVHTGLVVIGPVGPGGEITAIGDTVNLASRLESNAPLGGILISHETYQHVYGWFDVQVLPPMTVKGKPEPVKTYSVLRAKPRALARQVRGVAGVETRMIGREAELERLQTAVEALLSERKLHPVTVIGEPGIGKSCLLREFQKWLELLPEAALFFYGRATAEMSGLPFSLMRDVFSSRFEIQESDTPALAREKFETGLLELFSRAASTSALPPDELRMEAHFIGQLLGLDFSASPFLREIIQDTEQIRSRALHYLSGFFNTISAGSVPGAYGSPVGGVILVLEDIHWSDDGSLGLLEHLAEACAGAPVMILSFTRPTLFERRPEWGRRFQGHARLTLEPLSPDHSSALLESILRKAPHIPASLQDTVLAGSEGNPFYIEEIIKMLIDQRVIVAGAEQWEIQAESLAPTKVPPSLTAVLQARLDGLTPLERTVCQRASVVGRVFWDTALERMGASATADKHATRDRPLSKRELLDALTGLRAKELIFRRETSAFAGAEEYTFKHDLLRNVSYESLLKKQRRPHHADVARWLIESSGERIREFAGLVASHFENAAFAGEAADWYGRAGQQARNGYAPATASDYFRKALELLSPDETSSAHNQSLEWQEGLGETLCAQARFAECLPAYERMLALAREASDSCAEARAFNGLAFLHERRGDNRSSVDCATHAEAAARVAGEAGQSQRLRALLLKGWAFFRIGDASQVLALAEQTRDLCRELSERRSMALSYKLYGVGHLQLGHFSEAAAHFEQGLAIAEEMGDRRTAGAMWSNRGEAARLRGDYAAAVHLYEEALAISRQIGSRESEMVYLSNLAGARLGLRQFEKAETELREVIALSSSTNSCALAETYTFLSECCLGQGKLVEAMETARRALVLAKESESFLYLGGAWRSLGKVTARLEPQSQTPLSPDEPARCFEEALRVFHQMKADAEQARTLRDWAEFEIQQGRADEARKKLGQASRLFSQLDAAPELSRTAELLNSLDFRRLTL